MARNLGLRNVARNECHVTFIVQQPDAIRDLSDRDLAEATFLVLCALAEQLTCRIPVIIQGDYDGMANIIHGADGRVVWLTPPEKDTGSGQKHESAQVLPDTLSPIPASDAAAR
jgi:hypothetical protein